jgi:RNA polymerase sigma factor (sigma-70 family)
MDAILEPETETVDYQETGLARYLKEVGRCRLLNRSEERRLLERARRGDRKALDHLVTANLKWVVAVSAEYADRGLPMPDLIAEGNLGLIRAAVSFDPNQAFRFTAYALWWIRQALERALSRNGEDGERKGPVPAAPGAASRGAAPNPHLSTEVRQALEGVREPGRTVIKLFFGFDARRPLSLEQIAHLLGIPPARARQLKDLALRRLHDALPAPRRG